MPELQSAALYIILFISLFFEIFLLITYLEVREEMKFEDEHLSKPLTWFPSVSVIVPCFNEGRTVEATVRSILALDYPSDKLHLVLVDDGSTDDTLSILRKFESNPQIKVLTKENGGKFTALNCALENIDTDLVGCLDADSFVSPDALKKIVPYFYDKEIKAVIPAIRVFEPQNFLQRMQRIEYSWGIFLRRMLSSMEALYVTPGPFSIFRTELFRELGGYKHAHHTEDMEIALRMHVNGHKIVNSHGAHVYTVTPANFLPLVKQRVRWTYGFLNNVFDYRKLFFNSNYGHIGIFILPIATFSMFTTLYVAGNALWGVGARGFDIVEKYRAIGLTFRMPQVSFDWFYINTSTMSLIMLSVFMITALMIFLSLHLTREQSTLRRDIIPYLLLYILIVPVWLAKAVFNTFFRRSISWR